MNSKIVVWGSVATVAVVVTSWFGWTTYQRSVYEGLLASAEEITTKISSDNAPASLDVLSARRKNIDVAISTLNKIPPSSGDIYRKAQERWNKLKELDAQLTQRIENEKLAISSFEKAKALTDEANRNPKISSLTMQDLQSAYGKYQEAVFLLEKIPANTSVTAEVKQNLEKSRKNSEVVLREYQKRESLEKKKYEDEQRLAKAKEQERQAKLQIALLERQAALEKQLLQQKATMDAESYARAKASLESQARYNAEAQAQYNAQLEQELATRLPYTSFEKNVDSMQRAGVNAANMTRSLSGAYSSSTTKLSPVEMTIK
jgi:hypothetical protein